MNAKQILEQLNEQEVELDVQQIKKILDAAFIDYEIEEDEKITVNTYKTNYNEYKYYTVIYDNHCIMLRGDFKSLCRDLCHRLVFNLSDGFEQFFDQEALYNAMLKNSYYLVQTINMINKFEEYSDLYNFENIETVEVDGIEYVIFEEV